MPLTSVDVRTRAFLRLSNNTEKSKIIPPKLLDAGRAGHKNLS